jgi:hypothetical protein
MADNTPQNGTATIATDDIGGVNFQRVKLIHGSDGVNDGDVSTINGLPILMQGLPVSTWPGYNPPEDTAQRPITVDDYGALVTRGAVTTDEGTFRVNFANTSLAVSLGSVTVSGNTVTGTGFNTADIHIGDYFKLDSDAESAWTQVESMDSNTQFTLTTTYPGGTSGAASRALVQPVTAAGATISVASGQATLASGTTTGARAILARQLDYAPLVWRSRLSISQRIANQSTRFGLVDFGTPSKWFARFRAEGTTNTVLICESARNPTGAPSAAETESTTITLPNGLTTASLIDYRVEMLTERVCFYVNNILVAEHSRSLPSQYDILGSGVLIENTGTAASNTNVIIDYITGKSHNKIEIGVMSATEQIVASQPPSQAFNYSQAGVIAINTDLLVIDCSQLRGLSIQCTSMGTTGVVTSAFSNDGTTWVNQSLMTNAGVAAATFNAAGLWTTPVMARYFRLRLTTATTAGTTTLFVNGFQQKIGQPVAQPVSGTVTANIGTGSIAAGTNAIGDVGVQYRANATGAASFVSVLSPATPASATIKASAGRLIGWQLQNSNATGLRSVKVFNATAPTLGTTAAAFEIDIPANGRSEINLPGGIGFATAMTYSVTSAKGLTDNTATGLAANDVSGSFFFA